MKCPPNRKTVKRGKRDGTGERWKQRTGKWRLRPVVRRPVVRRPVFRRQWRRAVLGRQVVEQRSFVAWQRFVKRIAVERFAVERFEPLALELVVQRLGLLARLVGAQGGRQEGRPG